ncbi:MAG: hypothetical protein RL198_36 [Actinomycetota bacterium]
MANSDRGSKFDIWFATSALVLIAVSLVSLLTTLVLAAMGIVFLPVILGLLPQIGFPLGIAMIFTVVIRTFIRRGREQRG